MPDPKSNSYRSLWVLGLVITFPFILASGPAAGYYITKYILVRFMGLPEKSIPIAIGIGFAGSLIHIIQLLVALQKYDAKQKQNEKS